ITSSPIFCGCELWEARNAEAVPITISAPEVPRGMLLTKSTVNAGGKTNGPVLSVNPAFRISHEASIMAASNGKSIIRSRRHCIIRFCDTAPFPEFQYVGG